MSPSFTSFSVFWGLFVIVFPPTLLGSVSGYALARFGQSNKAYGLALIVFFGGFFVAHWLTASGVTIQSLFDFIKIVIATTLCAASMVFVAALTPKWRSASPPRRARF